MASVEAQVYLGNKLTCVHTLGIVSTWYYFVDVCVHGRVHVLAVVSLKEEVM